jgi:hypothetical protein
VLARNALVLGVELLSPKLNAVIVQKPGKMHDWHQTIRVVLPQLSHGISESGCCLGIGRHGRKHRSFDFLGYGHQRGAMTINERSDRGTTHFAHSLFESIDLHCAAFQATIRRPLRQLQSIKLRIRIIREQQLGPARWHRGELATMTVHYLLDRVDFGL